MTAVAQQLRERATLLLALALRARDDGHNERADSFTEMAAHCLDQAIALEQVAKPHYQPDRLP